MLRFYRSALVSLVFFLPAPMMVFAQTAPGGPTSTPIVVTAIPDTGTIESSAPSVGKVNCWISRSNTGAVAVTVYQEPSTNLSAKLRQYSKEEEEYSSKKTRIKVSPTQTDELSVVTVKLELVANTQDTYAMLYESAGVPTPIQVGYLKFARGTTGRKASDVVIRLASVVDGSVDPCNKPPIDDIGEEEEMPVGINSSPGPSLPFLPM